MKKYDKYIDSNIPLLNAIPAHWSLIKLRFLGEFSSSGIDKHIIEGEPLVKIINYTDVYSNLSKTLRCDREYMVVSCPKSKLQEHLVEKGDLIFTPSSETIDEIGFSSLVDEELKNTSFSYHVVRFKFKKEVDHNFKKYLCNNHYVLNYFSSESTGSTRKILDRGAFKNTIVVLPTLEEQPQIAKYLDHQTSIIDQLIKQKEKLIKLLKEKRQAVINEAVTKGLNPNATMKDSGIEWLGNVPENWNVTKLKFIIKELESGVSVNSENIPIDTNSLEKAVLKTSCVFNYSFNPQENKKVVEDEIDRVKCPVRSNTIIISRMNTPDLVGASGYVEKDYPNLFLPDRLWQTVINNEMDVDVEFISYILKSDIYRGVFSIIATGTSPSMKNIAQGSFLDLSIPFPNRDEQKSIKEYLKQFDNRTTNALKIIEESIDKLTEYRQSIISEVVTGKIDVRDWQPDKQNVA